MRRRSVTGVGAVGLCRGFAQNITIEASNEEHELVAPLIEVIMDIAPNRIW